MEIVMKTAYRLAVAFVAAASLSACVEEKVTKVPDLDRVVTVAEFTAQNQLRKKVVGLCSNDPGTLRNDANCVNALQAERMASIGHGNFPRIDVSRPDAVEKSASAAPRPRAGAGNFPRIDTSSPFELKEK
jgi:hypothetical protein